MLFVPETATGGVLCKCCSQKIYYILKKTPVVIRSLFKTHNSDTAFGISLRQRALRILELGVAIRIAGLYEIFFKAKMGDYVVD